MPKKNREKHDWDEKTNRCKKCEIHASKVTSLVYGCCPREAKKAERRRGYRGRKMLPE